MNFKAVGSYKNLTCFGSLKVHELQTTAVRNVAVHTVALLLLINILISKLCLVTLLYFPQSLQANGQIIHLLIIITRCYIKAVPCMMLTDCRCGGPGSTPRPIHVGFVVHKVALRRDFSEYFGFSLLVSSH